MRRLNLPHIACAAALVTLAPKALAVDFNFQAGDTAVSAVLNNTVTFGASWRIEDRADDLVGKANLNPTVCSGQYQSCQGLHRLQNFPAQQLARSPGMASVNFDDGNLNYDKGDITQAPFKLSQDLTVSFGNYGFFVRGIGIADPVNGFDFRENHPNLITADNAEQVGIADRPTTSNRYLPRVYGPGASVRSERANDEAQQIGLRFDVLDANFFGTASLPGDRELTFRVGRQSVNWGQSTVAVINSLNQAQPVNANSLYRLGFGLLEELFVPIGSVRAGTSLFGGVSMEAFYQYEWQPVEIPTPGAFFSFVDIGTGDLRDTVNAAFGGAADDPDKVGAPLDNPLTLITPTTLTLDRRPDKNARSQGQYGVSLKYYAEELNNGTELSLYYMNYHSKLPYVSFFSTNASCARRLGNARGIDARNTLEFLDVCPNLPLTAPSANSQISADLISLTAQRPQVLGDLGIAADPSALGGLANLLLPQPGQPASDAVPLDTAAIQLEYPEDRKLFGFSFTTTVGDISLQGEVAYRPNLPLQVALIDLAFASFGPVLTSCHDASVGCAGSQAGLGFNEAGSYVVYDGNDFTDASGNNPYPDTVNLVIGAAPGSARSFPNFITPFRGGTIGENLPNSYIQGWIPGKVAQYNIGATQVLGASENWIRADQVILLYELAATHVLNMPDFDKLQIEGPLTATTHASAGADGSGADGSRLACSTNPSCTVGPDGLRFNPFQARRSAFADAFSWGYRVVGRISYESVLPSISVQPIFILMHDIQGNSPGPAGNFVQGRKSLNLLLETRYEKALSFTVAYNTFFGGSSNNLYRDRDNLGFYFKYQF